MEKTPRGVEPPSSTPSPSTSAFLRPDGVSPAPPAGERAARLAPSPDQKVVHLHFRNAYICPMCGQGAHEGHLECCPRTPAKEPVGDSISRQIRDWSLKMADRQDKSILLFFRPRPRWMPAFVQRWLLRKLTTVIITNQSLPISLGPIGLSMLSPTPRRNHLANRIP